MEWPQIFTVIKTMFNELEILRSIPYSKLKFRSGANAIIEIVTGNMKKILLEYSLLIKTVKDNDDSDSNSENEIIEWNSKKSKELREVLLFLMLNTNLTYRRDIAKCNKNLEHLYKIFDLLPPFLFMDIVWHCQLDKSFYEMLSYAPTWLSHPYYEEAARSLSILSDPYDVVNKIEAIFEAAIVSIAVSRSKPKDSLHDEMLRETMPSYINKLLLHYVEGSALMRNFKGKKLQRFKGHLTLNLLKMSITAIKLYKHKTVMPADCKIYKTFMKQKVISNPENRNDLIKTLMLKVLNALQHVLATIDINTFMEWIEIDTDGGYDNLQQRIGALTFLLHKHFNLQNAMVQHDVQQELIVFIIEPLSFRQRIKKANIGKLLIMLEDKSLLSTQFKTCCNEIFKRPIVFGNDECINSLILYAHRLKLAHCKRIIGFLISDARRTISEYMNSNETCAYDVEKYTNLIILLYNIYKHLSITEKVEFLIFRHKHFAKFGDFLDFKLPEFYKRYHTFWNQFDARFDHNQFLLLCFEDEDGIWQQYYAHLLGANKFFDLAWQVSATYAEKRIPIIMKKTLLVYKNISNKFYANVFLQHLIKLPSSTQQDMEKIIQKLMLRTAKKQKFSMASEYVKLLLIIGEHAIETSPGFMFREDTANVIGRVAFVMDKALWKVHTFSYKSARLVTECQKFLEISSSDFAMKAGSELTKDVSKFIANMQFSRQVIYYLRVFFIQERYVPFMIFMEVCYKHKETIVKRNRMIATLLMRTTENEFIKYAALSYVTPKDLSTIINEMMFIAVQIDSEESINNFFYTYTAYMNFLINALDNDVDYKKWYYDELLDNIITRITTSKIMYNRLLIDSGDFFIAWIKHDKFVGDEIIIKLEQQEPCTNKKDVLQKLSSVRVALSNQPSRTSSPKPSSSS